MTAITDLFEAERPALTALCYRMLGERAAAEDVVQETWLRLSHADAARLGNPRAWLRRVATNIAIDTLRSARARRETYVGPWLPEPLIEATGAPAEDAFILAQECQLALLWAMERLDPVERAAFVLREAFDAGYDEISACLGKSEAACRQMVSRAHKRLQNSGPRFDVQPEELSQQLGLFLQAAATGDHATAKAILSDQAVAISDGGAKARAARRALNGPDEIVQVFAAAWAKTSSTPYTRTAIGRANGMPALLHFREGQLETVTQIIPDNSGRIGWIYVMRNPDKLAAYSAASILS